MGFLHDSLTWLEPYLAHYGYVILFAVIFVESFGVPAPGQTLLIAAAVLASHGKLNIVLVLLCAFAAAVIGDSLGYCIGYFGGHRLIQRFGKYVRIGDSQIRNMENTFSRYGGWFVTFARFFEVLRQVNGLVAGIAAMRFQRFLLFNATGALLWIGVWGLGTFYLGRHLRRYAGYFDELSLFFILALVVLLGVLTWYLLRHARRRGP
ncbi:MAG: DedA family protein [Gammaproteobacteria bacterium]|nr:DedA family protein [Gammaproteobacteria bacterium]MBU6508800.1 DedA family protein [Gammaproteobacteria bacterium]MDE1983250.1 DedA family protein [Gammaproteobacteria bacterium]MDE2107975.1 DedA family protein [Gammaproteobacteria bacterium]MDE2461827.1 DedA family protein [Gammaproteobacteria bacterium]